MHEEMRDHYRRLYRETEYGTPGNSPGLELFERVSPRLLAPVADLGCGRNLFAERCRAEGIEATGYDWAAEAADVQADITAPLDLSDYHTATAFDVAEHLTEEGARGLLVNLAATERAILTVHVGPSRRWLGRQLHLTRMPWRAWRGLISEYLQIAESEKLTSRRWIFYGRRNP